MKFKYQAKTKDGELQVGYVEAGDRDGAVNILAGHDLFILSVESAEKKGFFDNISSYFERARRKDLIIFARQLATLLEARLPLNSALKTLAEQTSNSILREAVRQIAEDIDAGLSFSQALERQGDLFPTYYVEMVRAAEVTGNLNEVADFLADYTEKEGDLATKAASAMVYPAIILLLFVAVAFILVAFVFPSLGAVFAQNNLQLPWYTMILLNAGTFLSKWWVAIVVTIVALGIVFANYLATDEGKALSDDFKIRFPLTRKVYLPVVMARFGNASALLLHGGIPIAQMLEIVGHMVGNILYRDVIQNVAEDVRQGSLLSESLAKYPEFFPQLVSQMVAVGETTGKIEDIFRRLSGIYTREADQVTSNLVDLIQPVLMIGMGIMVGLLFAAVLIPIYQLTASFQ